MPVLDYKSVKYTTYLNRINVWCTDASCTTILCLLGICMCVYLCPNEPNAFLGYVFTQITLLCLAYGLTCWMSAVNRDPSRISGLKRVTPRGKEMRLYPARHILIIARHASQHTTTSSSSY